MSRGPRRRLLAVLTVFAALLTPTVTPALASAALTAAPAAAPSAPQTAAVPAAAGTSGVVALASVEPAVATPGSTVRVRGTVTAPSDRALAAGRVELVLDDRRLVTRDAVQSWATGSSRARGRALADAAVPALAAGQSHAFTLAFPASQLRAGRAYAALPVSVELSSGSGTPPVDVQHTFVPWHGWKEYLPLDVAVVLPVTLDPDAGLYSTNAEVRAASWQEAIGPGSRIARILAGSAGSDVTLALDPSVLGPDPVGAVEAARAAPEPAAPGPQDPATGGPAATTPEPGATGPATTGATPSPGSAPPSTAAEPTPGATGDGATPAPTTPVPAPTTPEALPATGPPADLVGGVATSLLERSVWALPYADADLAASVDVDPRNTLVRELVDRSPVLAEALGPGARADVAWPVDGTLTAKRDKGLRTLADGTVLERFSGVVVSSEAVTATDAAYTPSAQRASRADTPLLAFDDRLSRLVPGEGAADAALVTQQFLADSLVLLGERAGTPRSVLVAPPRGFDPDAEGLRRLLGLVEDAEWLRLVDAGSLVDGIDPDEVLAQQTPRPAPEAIAPRPVLGTSRLGILARQRTALHDVASVLEDGAAFEATYREVLDELTSVRWRSSPQTWQSLNQSVVAETRAATSAIRVVPQGVNFLAENGTLRVTVANGLDYTVEDIRLVLQPGNPRMTVEQPGPLTINAGAKRTVPVEATAVAAGRVDIRAYLTTADGTPIGQPAILRVSANPLDLTFYWVGAGLVALVLVAGLGRSLLRGTSRAEEIGDLPDLDPAGEESGDRA